MATREWCGRGYQLREMLERTHSRAHACGCRELPPKERMNGIQALQVHHPSLHPPSLAYPNL